MLLFDHMKYNVNPSSLEYHFIQFTFSFCLFLLFAFYLLIYLILAKFDHSELICAFCFVHYRTYEYRRKTSLYTK